MGHQMSSLWNTLQATTQFYQADPTMATNLLTTPALPLVLQHASFQDHATMCKLMCTNKQLSAAIAQHCRRHILVEVNTSSLRTVEQFAAWLPQHHSIVGTLRLSITITSQFTVMSQATGDSSHDRAAATSVLTAALQQLPAPTALHGLLCLEFSGDINAVDTTDNHTHNTHNFLQQLSRHRINSLSLRIHGYFGSDSATNNTGPNPLGALAHISSMRGLQALSLEHVVNSRPLRSSNQELCSLTPSLRGLALLTQLELSGVPFEAAAPHLPAQLRELLLNLDAPDTGDGLKHYDRYYYRTAGQAAAAAGHPLKLSHLTALQKLCAQGRAGPVPGSVCIVAEDELPHSLQHLEIQQAFSVQPLLALQQLRVLKLDALHIPAQQLQQLNASLPQLQHLELYYDQSLRSHAEDRWDELWRAAGGDQVSCAWTQLPSLVALGVHVPRRFDGLEYVGAARLSRATAQHLGQLKALTELSLSWYAEDTQALAASIVQLTGLQDLTWFCTIQDELYDDPDEFYYELEPDEPYVGPDEQAVLEAVASLTQLTSLTLNFTINGRQSWNMIGLPELRAMDLAGDGSDTSDDV